MTRFAGLAPFVTTLLLAFPALPASAQIVETAGGRALGMGGAFVAVANDSSATWWNPAGLATGPFVDIAAGWAATNNDDSLPARHDRAAWFALTTPPFGFSYYHLRITDLGQFRTIGADAQVREDRRAAVPDWSLSANQFGVTLVHSIVSGVHAGTTLKYVRGQGLQGDLTGPENSAVLEWLERADQMTGETRDNFDLDLGGLVVQGPIRVGAVVRNVREMELGVVRVPRQARVGFAFDSSAVSDRPLIVAVDSDVIAYRTAFGDRRVVAIGAEGWTFGRRLGIRAGARFNTAGAEEQAYTAGASVAVRSRVFVDGHMVFGGADDESGWGIVARASF